MLCPISNQYIIKDINFLKYLKLKNNFFFITLDILKVWYRRFQTFSDKTL